MVIPEVGTYFYFEYEDQSEFTPWKIIDITNGFITANRLGKNYKGDTQMYVATARIEDVSLKFLDNYHVVLVPVQLPNMQVCGYIEAIVINNKIVRVNIL